MIAMQGTFFGQCNIHLTPDRYTLHPEPTRLLIPPWRTCGILVNIRLSRPGTGHWSG
jgi:hypothetical protein